ncbi:hypothetical protein PCE1_004576 [Barthelona sp. PCE]
MASELPELLDYLLNDGRGLFKRHQHKAFFEIVGETAEAATFTLTQLLSSFIASQLGYALDTPPFMLISNISALTKVETGRDQILERRLLTLISNIVLFFPFNDSDPILRDMVRMSSQLQLPSPAFKQLIIWLRFFVVDSNTKADHEMAKAMVEMIIDPVEWDPTSFDSLMPFFLKQALLNCSVAKKNSSIAGRSVLEVAIVLYTKLLNITVDHLSEEKMLRLIAFAIQLVMRCPFVMIPIASLLPVLYRQIKTLSLWSGSYARVADLFARILALEIKSVGLSRVLCLTSSHGIGNPLDIVSFSRFPSHTLIDPGIASRINFNIDVLPEESKEIATDACDVSFEEISELIAPFNDVKKFPELSLPLCLCDSLTAQKFPSGLIPSSVLVPATMAVCSIGGVQGYLDASYTQLLSVLNATDSSTFVLCGDDISFNGLANAICMIIRQAPESLYKRDLRFFFIPLEGRSGALASFLKEKCPVYDTMLYRPFHTLMFSNHDPIIEDLGGNDFISIIHRAIVDFFVVSNSILQSVSVNLWSIRAESVTGSKINVYFGLFLEVGPRASKLVYEAKKSTSPKHQSINMTVSFEAATVTGSCSQTIEDISVEGFLLCLTPPDDSQYAESAKASIPVGEFGLELFMKPTQGPPIHTLVRRLAIQSEKEFPIIVDGRVLTGIGNLIVECVYFDGKPAEIKFGVFSGSDIDNT